MRVIFHSLCTKGALKETRRVLDQFAERSTPITWQTTITQEGLDTALRVLRAHARRNTAVACFRVSGSRHDLLWVVGNRRKFSADGRCASAVLTCKATSPPEDSWVNGRLLRDLVDLAGLLHDLGKANKAFQAMLRGVPTKNQVRHEWISLRMLEAFVGSDTDEQWLRRLQAPTPQDDARWLGSLKKDFLRGLDKPESPPFASMAQAPLAQALGWLVVSHHRLPVREATYIQGSFLEIQATWNETPTDLSKVPDHWTFRDKCPAVTHQGWRNRAARVATRLLHWGAHQPHGNPTDNPFVMHLARLSLMLGDHFYSSLSPTSPLREKGSFGSLLANTEAGVPKQSLDEHLMGVSRHSAAIASTLPSLKSSLYGFDGTSRLDKQAHGKYAWQNKAMSAAQQVKQDTLEHGAFVVNMASTGYGKTLGNAKIVRAMSDKMRCAFALGLRTLTLQTGRAYQDYLGVKDPTQIAIRVGGEGIVELFQHKEALGSASADPLEDADPLFYEGASSGHPVLQRARCTRSIDTLVGAPLLVCTVDHLVPATDSLRSGRQITPMLRLLTSDVVLDEPDDFGIDDLPALTRLVNWAGLLGSRVVLSSATLSPALVQGLFLAYKAGRQVFAENMGQKFDGIPCLWVDENSTLTHRIRQDPEYTDAHQAFAQDRKVFLAGQAQKRMGTIRPLRAEHLLSFVRDNIVDLHQRHGVTDPVSGAQVSFGVCRMSNIGPLWDLASGMYQAMMPPGYHLHLCTYHSQFPLALRSHIEGHLVEALNRKDDPNKVFMVPSVRRDIDKNPAQHHIFLVVGSPVVQTGQDYDWDWGIIEPSDMRSLIQTAGRIRRHRDGGVTTPNVVVMSRNMRSFQPLSKAQKLLPAYRFPGFEDELNMFGTHKAECLFRPEEVARIDSTPLLTAPTVLDPTGHFVDLEHKRLAEEMLPLTKGVNSASWYALPSKDATLTGTLVKLQRFRRNDLSETQVRFALDAAGAMTFQEYDAANSTPRDPVWNKANDKLREVPLSSLTNPQVTPWCHAEVPDEMQALAQGIGKPVEYCYKDFGHVRLPRKDGGVTLWNWHPWLGFQLSD